MENQSINAFENLSVPRALAKFIIPSVLSQLTMLILNLTDAFFVGRTGDTYQISAMTITFPIVMTIGCIATIFAAGGNANIASALGSKNYKRAKQYSVFSIYTAIGIAALLSFILLAFENPILTLLGADGNSLAYSRGYILWVFHIACVPLAFCQVMAQLFIAEGETKIASMGIAGAGLINAVLDPVFIFALGQGVVGAGIANYCNLIFFLSIYYKKRKDSVLSLDVRIYSAKDGICKSVVSTGIPAGLNMLLLNCCDFLRNGLLGSYGGQVNLAAWGVVQKIGNAFTQICVGIGQGIRPLVAYNFTAKAIRRTKALIKGSFLIMTVYTVLCVILAVVIPELLVSLFLPVEEAMPVAVRFLQIWIFSIIAAGYIELFNSVFQAMGHWKISMVGVACGRMALMAVMLILVRFWGAIGVVGTQPITDSIVAVALIATYFFIMKKQEGKT